MLTLPLTIVAVLEPFAVLFTRPTWAHAQVLVIGTLLAQGPRTVTAALRAMGCRASGASALPSGAQPRALVGPAWGADPAGVVAGPAAA